MCILTEIVLFLFFTDDSGKDLASVQNLTKKHQLLEADILSHEERISDMNEQADALMKSEQFDTQDIDNKRSKLNEHFAKVKELATNRQSRLTEANTLHNFFRYYQLPIFYLPTIINTTSFLFFN